MFEVGQLVLVLAKWNDLCGYVGEVVDHSPFGPHLIVRFFEGKCHAFLPSELQVVSPTSLDSITHSVPDAEAQIALISQALVGDDSPAENGGWFAVYMRKIPIHV